MEDDLAVMAFKMLFKKYDCNCTKCKKLSVNKQCVCPNCKAVSKRTKRFWVRPYYKDRNNTGAFNTIFSPLASLDPNIFHNYMRMTPALFEELLLMVGPKIEKRKFLREPISAGQRIAITLR